MVATCPKGPAVIRATRIHGVLVRGRADFGPGTLAESGNEYALDELRGLRTYPHN